MADIDRIIEQLLGDRRISEGAAFSSRTYADQPLIERGSDLKARMERRAEERAARRRHEAEVRRKQARERRKAPPSGTTGFGDWVLSLDLDLTGALSPALERTAHEPLPERIREMRALENGGVPAGLAYGSTTAASLFRRQAELMADYEDDYAYHGGFSQYYPTYAAMSDHQLRGYFSWRTRVRSGTVEAAPLSFAFVYVYELLMGIGVEPGRAGLEALRDFGVAYRDADEAQGARLAGYLRRWLRDYAIYHGIPEEAGEGAGTEIATSVLTLLRAEHALLQEQGRTPRIANPAAQGASPAPDELFRALGAAASYHLCEARLAKDEPELLSAVARDVFAALVLHCSRRRKTDYVEGLFGYASNLPYAMFSAAVFCEAAPHPDCTVRVSDCESYVCADGRWRCLRAVEATSRSSELGLALHALDHELREQLRYPYPLKERSVPRYLQKIVRDAVAARLAERAEAERRRITIDLSKLGHIRQAAAVTQEALLTDEERGEQAAAPAPTSPAPAAPPAPPAPPAGDEGTQAGPRPQPELPQSELPLGLSELEGRLLDGLLAGTPAGELLGPADPFASVVADGINEKLFDLVGDAVIEFEGDEPRIIEDYRDDIREALHP